MTTLKKTIVTATLAVAIGTASYEIIQTSRLRDRLQTVQQQHMLQTEEVQQLSRERQDSAGKLARLRDENDRLRRDRAELPRLRGEVTSLRANLKELEQLKRLIAQQRTREPDAETQAFVPSESWHFAGYSTPEATVQSVLWALRQGDSNARGFFF